MGYNTWEQLGELLGHSRKDLAVALSPDASNQIDSGPYNKSVRIWDVKMERLRKLLRTHRGGPVGRVLA